MSDPSLVWDFIKCRIRTEAISYSIKNKKESSQYLADLNDRLCLLEDKISCTPTPNIIEEYNLTKNEIENIYNEKAMGHMVRSRVKLIAEFEKPSKYFLNLEKANQQIKHIRCLQQNGKHIFDPKAILDLQANYFAKLYTETQDSSQR